MTLTVEASSLSLNDVHRFLKLEELAIGSFTEFLNLEPLTEFEQQDLLRIRKDFHYYLKLGKISEGLVKFLTIAPLMRLAGFYDVPIRLTMEDSVAIAVEDEDRRITGRMDILAINSPQSKIAPPFLVVVIETKNSAIEVGEGLPQLLTYAFKSLDQQTSVWGLVDKGLKKQVYQDTFRTPDYFWFHTVTMELQGFHLVDGKYQEIQVTTDGRLWSQQLELYLGVYEGKLRFFTTENQLILSSEELAEQERLRADQAEERAKQAEEKLALLREVLRTQGIDLENI